MSRDEDRHQQRLNDYWYHRNKDLDWADDTQRTKRELEGLRLKLVVEPPPCDNEPPTDYKGHNLFKKLLDEKEMLLNQLKGQHQDELYRLLDRILLSESTVGPQFDQLIHILEQRIQSLSNKHSNETTFSLLAMSFEQERKYIRDNLRSYLVTVKYIKGMWGRFHA